jgi:hypothetical protein
MVYNRGGVPIYQHPNIEISPKVEKAFQVAVTPLAWH